MVQLRRSVSKGRVSLAEFAAAGVPKNQCGLVREEAKTLSVLVVRDRRLSQKDALAHIAKLTVQLVSGTQARSAS